MLKLTLPLLSIFIIVQIKNFWWAAFLILLLLTTYSLTLFTPLQSTLLAITKYSILDQTSSIIISLSLLITTIIILASNKIIISNTAPIKFIILSLLLLFALIRCFSTSSIISFYICFEATLVPTLLIILYWGYQPERIQAGIYIIMYTICASLPILIILIVIISASKLRKLYITSIFTIHPSINFSILWLFLILGFLVKLPIFSTHLWLPKAHVEAPIAGSIILAAVLLKLGGYGLIRIISILPFNLIPNKILIRVSLYGAILTRLICIRQPDIKALIAYSSIGHMGIMLAGILSYSMWGISASLIIIIAHGLGSSAIFIIANLSYSITHTRSVYLTKGIISICPTLSIWWFLFLSVNIAAPPSINLLREIILITSISRVSTSIIIILALLRFFTGAYSLHLFAVTQHGQSLIILNPSKSYSIRDILLLSMHLLPLLILIIK